MFMALLVLCFLISFPSVASAATQTDAGSAIASAQKLLLNCYNAAKASEAAGANITVLEVSLNDAGRSLSNAELAYSNGDYNSAVNYANQCQSALSNFVPKANALKASGEQQRSQGLVIFVGSIVGALAVVGAGYVVWLQVKKKYTNQ
jgi:cobalamin biosynthesis Mg chelatase CobN